MMFGTLGIVSEFPNYNGLIGHYSVRNWGMSRSFTLKTYLVDKSLQGTASPDCPEDLQTETHLTFVAGVNYCSSLDYW
jgi:hypothetical protein